MRFTFLALIFCLSWNIFPILDLGCLVSQLILLLLAWLPLQFRRDRSRDLPWSVHHVLFLFQSLLLPLSLWAFYCGLQGPLPLESLSHWSRFRHGTLLLIYGAVLCLNALPPELPRPNLPWKKSSYSYSLRLYVFLDSFQPWDWSRPLNGLVAWLHQVDVDSRWHGQVDWFLRVLLPYAFLSGALLGIVLGDLRWLLLLQPLQLWSRVYVHFQFLLLKVLQANLDVVREMIHAEPRQGLICARNFGDFQFSWTYDSPLSSLKNLEKYARLWYLLTQREKLWRSWETRSDGRVLLSLRIVLAASLGNPIQVLASGFWVRVLRQGERTLGSQNAGGPRFYSTKAYWVSAERAEDLEKETQGLYKKSHPVGTVPSSEGERIDGTFTHGPGLKECTTSGLPWVRDLKNAFRPQRYGGFGKTFAVDVSRDLKYIPGSEEKCASEGTQEVMNQSQAKAENYLASRDETQD